MIQLQEALTDMEKLDEYGRPVPFTVTFITCDEERGTGGEPITLENVVLAKLRPNLAPTGRRPPLRRPKAGRPANERDAQTRNFYNPTNEQVRKAHIRLIVRYNGQPVHY